MADIEFVRVRMPSGMETTVSRTYANNAEGVQLLDEPAVDGYGRPLPSTREGRRPALPRTSVDEAAATKRTRQQHQHEGPAFFQPANTDDGEAVDSQEA